MATIFEAFETYFRTQVLPTHKNPTLFKRWLDNVRTLETQLMVSSEGGTPVPDKRGVWTDGIDEWQNIRVPRNAMNEPYFRDRELPFLLEDHWLAIGSTFWDWVNKESAAVGFDFDAVTSHAAGIGVTDEQLEAVKRRACELDYVDVIKSTSGTGLHLYIWFAEGQRPQTANHTEHAAVARAMLGKLSTDAAFDFGSHLDVCGSVLWVAHKEKMKGTDGFTSIKEATRLLTSNDLPPNWRDNIDVVKGKSTRVRVVGVDDFGETVDEQDPLAALTNAHVREPLDDVHKKIISDLELTGCTCVWVPDHHLIQTHTAGLKQVYDQWKDASTPMKGFFDTVSPGQNRELPNCFMIPNKDGAFAVFRFGKGTMEHDLWYQDREGWTWCNYNRQPNLSEASIALGGAEIEGNKGFCFMSVEEIQSVVESMGSKLVLPDQNDYTNRESILRRNKDGRLVVEIEKKEGDRGFVGWNGLKKNRWIKVFNITVDSAQDEDDYTKYDTLVRSCRSTHGDSGWRICVNGEWIKHPRENVGSVLALATPDDVPPAKVMGTAILNQWLMVCKPFHEEFPGDRTWNLNAPQLVYKPENLEDDERPYHPHWDLVLSHCGEELDDVIPENSWCRNWGIFSGRDYLTAWISCLIKEPFEPLPYLFMYGDQLSGKSIFHEAISSLLTCGVKKADRALTSPGDYNGELANAVLGVVDEVNIAHAGPSVYAKIKEWTTGKEISIHAKFQQVYQQRNCLHFCQMANHRDDCPIFPGDTRITSMYVAPLVQEIPKPILMRELEREAPHFMHTLIHMDLPDSSTRLRLPILNTAGKVQAADSNRDPLEEFMAEVCFSVPGDKILFKDFYTRFTESISEFERATWTKRKVRQNMPTDFPIGVSTGGQLFIGNLSFAKGNPDPGAKKYIAKGRRICLEGDNA